MHLEIKTGYYLEFLTPETMKLLRSTENKISKDKKGENVPHLEVTEAVLVHCSIVNNHYQQDSRVLYTFVRNKPFGSLLETSPKNHILLKTFNSEFQAIEIRFTDQKCQPLEIEDRIYLTLVINNTIVIKMRYSIEPKDRIYVKRYGFLSFTENMGKILSNKYGQKVLDSTEKYNTGTIKTASKRAILKQQKQLLIYLVIKLQIKLQVFQKKSSKEMHSQNEDEMEIPKERHISNKKKITNY